MHRWFIFGDSHTGAFEAAAKAGLIKLPAKFLSVGGATAIGLRNPNSMTDAMSIFRDALLPKLPRTVPVIHLGEVDCGFVIWWRSQKYGESVERQLEHCIEAQFQFIDKVLGCGYKSLVVSGATIPTIRNGTTWGEVANKRREVTATLQQRTALTLHFNQRLKQEAISRRLPFIDISHLIIDPDTGCVDDSYRHPDPLDHHLHPERAGAHWATALNQLNITL